MQEVEDGIMGLAALEGKSTLAQLQGQRLLTAVFLVKALGGGWSSMQ